MPAPTAGKAIVRRPFSEAMRKECAVDARNACPVVQASQLHAGRMNDMPRLQLSRRGEGRAAHGNRADFVAFALHRIPRFAANHAGQAAAELEVVIGGIDDGVHIHFRQIALLQNDFFADGHRC